MDLFEAVRLQALRDVLSPDQEYLLRRIHRWYSRTFSTPLAEAFDVPLEDVLQAWFEEKYESMDLEALEQERQELLETPDQRQARLQRDDEEQAEADEFAKMVAAEEQEKAEKAKLKKSAEAKPLVPGLAKAKSIVEESDLPDSPPLTELPPNIEMKFVDSESFEQELEGLGAMAQPIKDR